MKHNGARLQTSASRVRNSSKLKRRLEPTISPRRRGRTTDDFWIYQILDLPTISRNNWRF